MRALHWIRPYPCLSARSPLFLSLPISGTLRRLKDFEVHVPSLLLAFHSMSMSRPACTALGRETTRDTGSSLRPTQSSSGATVTLSRGSL
jgi:hypothetical protein